MLLRASEFLAADLRLSGSTPADQAQIDAGLELGLEHARAVEFSSVVAAQDGIQLASVKAASTGYPLRGELRIARQPQCPGKRDVAAGARRPRRCPLARTRPARTCRSGATPDPLPAATVRR
ncbi:UNVERIFIED_CONTAM: hypothetical protein NCL1_55188 [Trichonephila clavipes]